MCGLRGQLRSRRHCSDAGHDRLQTREYTARMNTAAPRAISLAVARARAGDVNAVLVTSVGRFFS